MVIARQSAAILIFAAGLLLGLSGPGDAEEAGGIMSPKITELQEKLKGADSDSSARLVSAFLEENAGRFPLIEDSLVTFVYTGPVGLRATVPSDINRWDTNAHEMKKLSGTDLYYFTLTMPVDARIDYKFYVDRLWMLDPFEGFSFGIKKQKIVCQSPQADASIRKLAESEGHKIMHLIRT